MVTSVSSSTSSTTPSTTSSTSSTSGTSSTSKTTTSTTSTGASAKAGIISKLGSGSGIDITALTQSLVEAEKAPRAEAINKNISKNEALISGFAAVKYALTNVKAAFDDLKDKSDFISINATTNQNDVFTATATTETIYFMGELDTRTPGITANTDIGYYLDNVSISEQAPEPASLALFGTGIALVGRTLRRKRQG